MTDLVLEIAQRCWVSTGHLPVIHASYGFRKAVKEAFTNGDFGSIVQEFIYKENQDRICGCQIVYDIQSKDIILLATPKTAS